MATLEATKTHYLFDGQELRRVTKILDGSIPKYLVPWATKLVAEYAFDNRETWSNLDRDAAVALLKGAADRSRDRAAQIGTSLHSVFEGKPVDFTFIPEAKPYADVLARFLNDYGFEPIVAERTVVSTKHGYAGSFDAIGRCTKAPELGTCVLDLKTGKSIYQEVALQLSAYRHAEGYFDNGTLHDMPAIDGGLVLHLGADDYQVHPVECGTDVFEMFLHCVEVARFTSASKAAVIGSPLPKPGIVAEGDGGVRRAWLIERIEVLRGIDGAFDFLAACWPEGVPTFKQEPVHTDAQLDLIEAVIALVETEKSAPFADKPAELLPKYASDADCAVVIARLQALPSDLLAVAESKKGDLPNLKTRSVPVDMLAEFDRAILTPLEVEAAQRTDEALDILGDHRDDDVLVNLLVKAAANRSDIGALTEADLERLAALVKAFEAGHVSFSGTVLVADEAPLLALGGKSAVVGTAKAIADMQNIERPKAFADVVANPLLAALVHVSYNAPQAAA